MAEENKGVTPETPEAKPEENKQPSVEELMARNAELENLLNQSKQAYNNASSDAATWKKKFRETQDDATRAEAERTEEVENLKKQVADFQRQISISSNVTSLLAMGYPQSLAEKRAEYIADGDIANAMAVEKEFLDYHDRELKAAAVRNTPAPASGFPASSAVTKEQFANMTLRERTEFRQKNPEQYSEFTKH